MFSQQVDVYQERYLEHQARKRESISGKPQMDAEVRCALFGILRVRKSQRIFSEAEITEVELNQVYEAIRLSPSSCNRQAILVKPVTEEREKAELDCLLVGGKNWLGRAQIILLLFADMLAYKSPIERDFMPYLDAGFVGENVYLAATALNVGVCFVNPNIRKENKVRFDKQFNPRRLLFCGAMALGKYAGQSHRPPKRELKGIFY